MPSTHALAFFTQTSQYITMSFPGLPNRGLGGDSTAGMSDQEAKMVKAVSFPLQIQEEARFLPRARS